MPANDWVLAIDFGTTNTVAATTDAEGTRTPSVNGRQIIPSAVFLDPDSRTWITGEAALRAARRSLDSFEPNPKLGVPDGSLFLGGRNVPVGEAITAVLAPIVAEAARQHGNRHPAAFVVTHPANWGEARVNVLLEAAAAAAGRGWPRPQPLSEPIAAAQAILGMADIPQQARLVVLDLGGGTVDAAAVDRDGDALTVVGEPQGQDGIGGEDYDRRLARWMVDEVGAPGLYDRLASSDDPDLRERAIEIRADARNVKEQLSFQASVPAQLRKSPPELLEVTPVLVSRPQLEDLIRGGPGRDPGLIESVDVVSSVLGSIPPGPPFVGVFLTGGCSRIPMLGSLIQERTGRPPLTFGDPTMAVAQGAAQRAWKNLQAPPPPPPPGSQGGVTGPPPDRDRSEQRRRQTRRLAVLVAAVLGVGGLITGVALAASGHPAPPPIPPPTTAPPTTAPPTTGPTTGPTTAPPTTPGPTPTTPVPTTPVPTTPVPTTPPQALDFNYTGASPYPCSSEGTIHSVGGGLAASFAFVNDSSQTVLIIWINYSGNREMYDTLPAGDTYTVNTFEGNAWMIANYSANCQGIFGINGSGGITIS